MLRVQGQLPEGIAPYDEGPARRGYRMNRMMYDLRLPERRQALLADSEAFYRGYELGDEEVRLLLARDWPGLIEAGANIYALVKLGAALGENLLQMGARMRDEPVEAFLARKGVEH
jgi:protocatechuate 4,5-dioxygenase, alpha chain